MLDSLRKDLLNLSLANNLLKLKDFKAKGLDLNGIEVCDIYECLIENEKKILFEIEIDENETEKIFEFELINGKSPKVIAKSNTKRITQKLRNTYKEAKEFTEERGINALYLSIGALKWYEDENSDIELFAPLLLIPIELIKTTDQGEDEFTFKYGEGNIEPNYTLERKLKQDFDINFPKFDYSENTYENIVDFFELISKAINKKVRWQVIENKITLNIFSFLKIMMYLDLDDTKWKEDNIPSENEFISRLISNNGDLSFQDENQSQNSEVYEETKELVREIGNVLDADSSQIEAINLGLNKKCLVIKGPPGTGKSQTITNFIASCVEKNKKVLFVAEKLAALKVVKNRLDIVGLELSYLELHSHKANRKEVLDSINLSLLAQTNQGIKDNNEYAKLESEIESLNKYYDVIFSSVIDTLVYDIVAELTEIKTRYPDLTIFSLKQDWESNEIKDLDSVILRSCNFIDQNGLITNFPFYGIENLQLTFVQREQLVNNFTQMEDLLTQLNIKYLEIKNILGFKENLSITKTRELSNWLNLLENSPGTELLNIKEAIDYKSGLKAFFKLGEELLKIHHKYDNVITNSAHLQNFYIEKTIFENKKDSFLRFLSGDLKKARQKLYSVLKFKPDSIDVEFEILNAIVQKTEIIDKIESLQSSISHTFKLKYDFSKNLEWLNAKDQFEFLEKLDGLSADFKIADLLHSVNIEYPIINEHAYFLKKNIADFEDCRKQINSLIPNEFITKRLVDRDLEESVKIIKRIASNFDLINLTFEWNALKENLILRNGDFMVKHLEALTENKSAEAYQKWRKSILTILLDKSELNGILNNEISLIAADFKKLDQFLVNKYNREKTKYKYLNGIPSKEALGEQMNILRSEIIKKRRHMPLRKLLTKAGNTITSIKPVFMMSPLSVAQYLTPDEFNFDFVIFDEASQIKPVEAFGALLRAEKAIIVGDDKQLPPSSFFDNVSDTAESYDEENDSSVADVDSILDLFVARNSMQTMLNWHYRSKHESLIAISNKLYYESNLICLPSPNFGTSENGLLFEHCPETIYSGQKNEQEAELIVERLLNEIKKESDPSKCSIGIVAFSIKQKDCIENLLQSKRKKNGVLDRYLSAADKTSEPFFVKNLENVQGDERDIIIISICYGKNEQGKMIRRFGPVNNPGGERRLNVLFTRAKEKCIVFSNFTAGDISVSETDPLGLKMLKAFLDYAQNRKLTTEYVGENRTDSPFEAAVKRQLERNGFEVHTQIGSAGYFIDLAIPHPNQKGRYVLGIECDGAAYHGSKSARERDRLRQGVLEGLGWEIHRIWSTDWFKNPQKELNKLLDKIALLTSKLDSKANKFVPETKSDSFELPKIEIEEIKIIKICKPYEQIDIDVSSLYYELHETPQKHIIEVINQLVQTEAPLHKSYMKYVITRKLGIGRIGSRIDDHFEYAFRAGEKNEQWTVKGDFVYEKGKNIDFYRNRNSLPEKERQIEWIAPEEIKLAILCAVEQAGTIRKDELFRHVLAELNGGIRLTEGINNVIETAFQSLMFEGKVVLENELVKNQI